MGEQRSGELGVTPGYIQGEGHHSSTRNKKATLRIQRVLLQAQALGRHQHYVVPPPPRTPLPCVLSHWVLYSGVGFIIHMLLFAFRKDHYYVVQASLRLT